MPRRVCRLVPVVPPVAEVVQGCSVEEGSLGLGVE